MTTATWISLIVTLVGMAVVWGSQKNEIGNLKTALAELKAEFNRSKEDQGKRIGSLETETKVQRAITQARGVRVIESGDDDR